MTGPSQNDSGQRSGARPDGRGASGSPLIQLVLDAASAVPLYRQLYDGLRDAILSGRLAGGARLPSSRALAADLEVARNTVLVAYDQLRNEGYLVGRRGGGTRVRRTMPDALLTATAAGARRGRARAPETARDPSARPAAVHPGPEPRLSSRGRILVESGTSFLRSGGGRPVPFEIGWPAADVFPLRRWAQLAGRRWRHGDGGLRDADPAGDPALRATIASHVVTARGGRCTADQVLVVNGAQHALHLIAQVLLDPGDPVWIEDPGYIGARAAFAAAGAALVPVPVDAEGLDVRSGMRLESDARLAYVTPSHQFPLGVVMGAPRRLQLLSWARGTGAWIIEDDYDSEFRYAGRPLPCLQGLEAEQGGGSEPGRVLYVGTFSKTLVPGLRLGYVVVPDPLIDAFRAARSTIDRHTATPHQQVLADFMSQGHYARHVRRVRNLCAERQEALLAAASARLAGLLTFDADPAGLHLVGRLAADSDDVAAARAAAANGVRVSPLSRSVLRSPNPLGPALLLGYGAYDEAQIRDGVDRLARALEIAGRRGGATASDPTGSLT